MADLITAFYLVIGLSIAGISYWGFCRWQQQRYRTFVELERLKILAIELLFRINADHDIGLHFTLVSMLSPFGKSSEGIVIYDTQRKLRTTVYFKLPTTHAKIDGIYVPLRNDIVDATMYRQDIFQDTSFKDVSVEDFLLKVNQPIEPTLTADQIKFDKEMRAQGIIPSFATITQPIIE